MSLNKYFSDDKGVQNLVRHGFSQMPFHIESEDTEEAIADGVCWARKGLEKILGDTIVVVEKLGRGRKTHYNLVGPLSLETYSKEEISDDERIQDKFKPGVLYISKYNAPREGGSFVGAMNPEHIIGAYGIVRGYLMKKEDHGQTTRPIPEIDRISTGPYGMVPKKVTDIIADSYGFPRPKEGDIVPVISHYDFNLTSFNEENPQKIFSAVVYDGPVFQVAPQADADRVKVLEVVLGIDKHLSSFLFKN